MLGLFEAKDGPLVRVGKGAYRSREARPFWSGQALAHLASQAAAMSGIAAFDLAMRCRPYSLGRVERAPSATWRDYRRAVLRAHLAEHPRDMTAILAYRRL